MLLIWRVIMVLGHKLLSGNPDGAAAAADRGKAAATYFIVTTGGFGGGKGRM